MTTAPLPAELIAALPGLSSQAGGILRAVAALIARAFLKDPRHVALINPLWRHFTRAALRLDRVLARLATGIAPNPPRIGPPRPSLPRPGRPAGKPRAGLALPTRFAWLRGALGDDLRHFGNNYGSQLDHLLSQPEFAALLAQSPQAARILRPVCRFLGIRPQSLPPLPRRTRAAPTPTAPIPTAPIQAGPAPQPPARPPHPAEPPCPRSRWPWFTRDPAPPIRGRLPEATLDIAIFQRK